MRATQATFKLGISLENWANIGDKYIHSFGVLGQSTWMAEFHEFWLEARDKGFAGPLEDYCLELKAAKREKFATQVEQNHLNYAYHLDATAFDILIDFTHPSATNHHVDFCVEHGKKMVIGTTGFSAAQQAEIEQAGAGIAVCKASNFSVPLRM